MTRSGLRIASNRISSIGLLFTLLMCLPAQSLAQSGLSAIDEQLETATGADRIPLLMRKLAMVRGRDVMLARELNAETAGLLEQFPNDSLYNELLYLAGTIEIVAAQYDSSHAIAQVSARLAEERQDTLLLAKSVLLEGDALFRKREYEAAGGRLTVALEHFASVANRSGEGMALMSLGNLNNNQGNYDAALGYYGRALEISQELEQRIQTARISANMGVVYRRLGQYEEALDRYLSTLEIWQESNNKPALAVMYLNLGGLYYQLEDYDEALSFSERSLALNEELGRQQGIADALVNIGDVHLVKGEYDEAFDAFNRSMEMEEEIGDKEGFASALKNIGWVHVRKGEAEEALTYFNRALEVNREVGNPELTANTLLALGEIYLETDDKENALIVTQEAEQIASEIEALPLIVDGQELLSQIWESQGDFEQALLAYKEYKAAGDSLFNAENESVIAELQTRYRTKEQAQEIDLLQSERKIQNLIVWTLLLSSVLLGIIATLILSRYRIKQRAHQELDNAFTSLKEAHDKLHRTQEQLVQSEKMASLGRLTAGIAHEIRNPINFVNNFSHLNDEMFEELAANPDAQIRELAEVVETLKENGKKITEYGHRADQIVQSMLQHSSGSTGGIRAVAINGLVEVRLKYFADLINDLQHDLDANVTDIEIMPQEIDRVLTSLLENSIDAVNEQARASGASFSPKIEVQTLDFDNRVEIRVTDNGAGISAEHAEHIFEPFFTTKPAGAGIGLGLSLSYDTVVKGHGGSLTFESNDSSTTFIVSLKKDAIPSMIQVSEN